MLAMLMFFGDNFGSMMSSGIPARLALSRPLPNLVTTFWRAPLAPLALAATAGILIDRHLDPPLALSLMGGAAFLAAWLVQRNTAAAGLGLVYLCCGTAALAAVHHRLSRGGTGDDHITHFAVNEPRPVRLRGFLQNEPIFPKQAPVSNFRGLPAPESTNFVLRLSELRRSGRWQNASGLVQVRIAGRREGLHLGDHVEITGQLSLPADAGNPGEFDYAEHLRGQGIHALLSVRILPATEGNSAAVSVIGAARPRSLGAGLAWIGNECRLVLDRALPGEQAAVARALLLGDNAAMTSSDWDKYLNTGVIHALAISGQHLVVLGGFVWLLLRVLGVRRRWGAVAVALLLLGYALLVGARPPVMRAAWTVLALCIGMILQRPVLKANAFALAWLLVAIVNPADIFSAGCLLSFLAVAVLCWGTGRRRAPVDPLERLLDESRPAWWRRLRRLAGMVITAYAFNLAVWLAITPLAASRFHLVSPVALLIGPPVTLLTSVALLFGFLLLILAPVCWPLAVIPAAITEWSLACCEGLVQWGADLPGAYWYVPDLAAWWLWGFYVVLLAALTVETLWQRRQHCLLAGLGWLALGLAAGLSPWTRASFRCTFVAVGHGGCTVLETPDGRTLLYDAGAMAGPDVTRRHIAPFLWSRGIRRIDELFLSHADLDHFNGVGELLERFAVGQVTTTPNFSERDNVPVKETLAILKQHGIPLRTIHAGHQLGAGGVTIKVLHPPPDWRKGNENARSLVLLVSHGRHTILLTGDLEGPGLERVLGLPPVRVDILMAPHHGSRTANTQALAEWADPRVVVSCQGKPRGGVEGPEPYTTRGARFLPTWPHGAVTVRAVPAGLRIETYRTQERWLVESRRK